MSYKGEKVDSPNVSKLTPLSRQMVFYSILLSPAVCLCQFPGAHGLSVSGFRLQAGSSLLYTGGNKPRILM